MSTGLVYIIILPLSILSFLSYKQSLVWRNTETLFRNVAEQHPTSHIAWNNLGSLALERLDIKTAMKDYERSLTIRPNAAAFFNLGQIAMKKGLVREAMELYRRAIASRPNDTDSLLNLGVLHLRNGNAVAAADFFRRAIAFDDRLAIAHFNLGLALEAQKDHDGARSAYTRALELDPNDRETREKLAL
ncbi:tetratricopeptide repeat protein [Candidatus Peregrinibacteria bacterium]|nr:tetratricopeptide repeat protein [Candidatus Peregrinibacteria bacterium]